MAKLPLSYFSEKGHETLKDFPVLNPSSSPTQPPQEQSFLSKALETGGSIVKSIEKPFVDVAAIPVQLGAKALGLQDPYQESAAAGKPSIDVNSVDKPLQKLGSASEVASYLIPYGRFAKLGTLGKLAAGAASGYGVDVASNLAEGKTGTEVAKPGLGTFLGATLPAVSPIKNAIGRVAGETLGVTTGTGYGVIKEAYNAAKAGGKELQSFTDSLRGKVSPDQIVQEARDSLGQIITNRRQEYQKQLTAIAGDTRSLDISPIVSELGNQLDKFKIGLKNGELNFGQSAIRFDKEAQKDVTTIFDELKTFGTQKADRTAVGVDSLKQALGDLYSKSSNVRALVTGVKSATRKVLGQVEGYDQMTKNYAETTDIIQEIQKGLSLGDQAQVDTAFKKLTSSLRQNNDQRKEMIQELDSITGGELLPKIAGEQMNELLPRGIMRPLEGATAIAAGAGGFLLPLLKFAAFASPRIVGEMIRSLGFSEAQVDKIINAIGGMSTLQRGVNPVSQLQQSESQQQPQSEVPLSQESKTQRSPLSQFQSR